MLLPPHLYGRPYGSSEPYFEERLLSGLGVGDLLGLVGIFLTPDMVSLCLRDVLTRAFRPRLQIWTAEPRRVVHYTNLIIRNEEWA